MDDTESLTWHPAATFEDLPDDGTGRTVTIDGVAVALFRVGEQVHAVADTCPHEGASLGCGVLSRSEVTCPWHGWHFDLGTGRNTDGLDETLAVYPTRRHDGGEVEVGLPG